MNKKIRIIVILGVLCLVLAGYAVVTSISKNSEESEEGIVLSSMDPEDMTGFSYQHHNDEEYTDEIYSFVKEDGIWYYEDDKDFPVYQLMAETKAEIISEITAERVVEENPDDIARYGLDNPYLTVSVSDAENTYVYHVGDYNASTATYYILKEGSDTVYLADSELFIAFDIQLWDMISKETFPELDVETFTRVTFEFPNQKIDLKKAKLESDYIKEEWYLLDDNGQILENTNKVETSQYPKLIPEFIYLREVDYKCEDLEYEQYGLSNPEIKISVEYEIDGKADSFVLLIGSITSENSIYEDYYAKSNKSDAVMTISYELLEKLSVMNKENMILQ